MCGITGIIESNYKTVEKKELLNLSARLKHRGPDGEGVYINQNVGFAMRRLSIIDVIGGDQPLYNENKSIAIVGNGEIYNYIELQKELTLKGHKLKTGSDIETAIHAYEEWGEKAFNKLRGMFALAIHDSNKNIVYLLRDRMGEKPIYYTKTSHQFIFASELKALSKQNNIDKSLDHDSINIFFHFYFIPEPNTPFINIKKIPSGSYLKYDIQKNTINIIKYWDPSKITPKFNSDPVKSLLKIFKQACELTLRSDVPVGLSLSGGIDSSSILAISAKKYKGNLKTFSVGYEGTPTTDERQMAKKLASKYNVKYFETEIKRLDVVNHFPMLIWQCDEPIADIAAHSIYEVSKLAKKHGVKVLLNGAGGDELFWGYPSTIEAALKNINRSWISELISKKSYFYNNPNPVSAGKIVTQFYSKSFADKINQHGYNNFYPKPTKSIDINKAKQVMDSVRDLWLKNDVVTLGDRMSMASSVELRAPYLDYKLIEYVLNSKKLVDAYKLEPKHYQKNMFKGILSDELLNRPKRGFTPPVGEWILAILKKYRYLFNKGFLVKEGIIDSNKLNLGLKVASNIPTYTAYQLLVMEIWGRLFVYNEKIK